MRSIVPEVGTLALTVTVIVFVEELSPPKLNELLDQPALVPVNDPVIVSPAVAVQLPL